MSRRRILTLISISLFIALVSILWRSSSPSFASLRDTFLTFKIKETDANNEMATKAPLGKTVSVIIVGSGLAGLSAAAQLISHSIPVILFERTPKPGGNSIKASSGINGAPTKYQPGPPYSDSFFYSDTVSSAGSVFSANTDVGGKKGELGHKEREKLIRTLTNESAGAVEWLVGKGVDLSVVAKLGGHSFPRTHRPEGKTPPGAGIVFALLGKLKESETFELKTGCEVTKVLKTDDKVVGVEYVCEIEGAEGKEKEKETRTLYGPVIFTSGGFGGDSRGMLATYAPGLAGFPSTNSPLPGSTPLLTSIGAQLVDMDLVQVHPTSFVLPSDPLNPNKFLAAELLRGEGGILLHEGKRFVDEMQTRKVVTASITALPEKEKDPRQWDINLVIDEGVYENASSHIDFYLFKGLMRKTTINELEPKALETIKTYSKAAEGEVEDRFGRTYFGHWKLKPEEVGEGTVVYVGRVTPAVHFTMGGVVIDDKSEVIREGGGKIEGLWAAGEVTGGVHGENRLGGSSLLECVVFGRIAGNEAAKYVSKGGK